MTASQSNRLIEKQQQPAPSITLRELMDRIFSIGNYLLKDLIKMLREGSSLSKIGYFEQIKFYKLS